MRKILKKVICVGVMLIVGLNVLCACNDNDDVFGESYTLQQAYDNGLLSETDLQSIAFYFNDRSQTYPESLDSAEATKIKKAKATLLRNDEQDPNPNAKAEDFEILRYYGKYNGLYVVTMNSPYVEEVLEVVDRWETIGGVNFHQRGRYYIIWAVKI